MNKKCFIIVIPVWIIALIANWSTGFLEAIEQPIWIIELTRLISWLVTWSAIGLSIYLVIRMATILTRQLWVWISEDDKSAEPPTPEVQATRQAMSNLVSLLSQIEPDVKEADARLLDAKIWTETLADCVLRLAEIIEKSDQQLDILTRLQAALGSDDRPAIARLYPGLDSVDIKNILASPYAIKLPRLKEEAGILIASRLGVLDSQVVTYDKFITALMIQIGQAGDRIATLEQGKFMLEASHPLIEIEQNLTRAGAALKMLDRPGLRYMARQVLPAQVSTKLLV